MDRKNKDVTWLSEKKEGKDTFYHLEPEGRSSPRKREVCGDPQEFPTGGKGKGESFSRTWEKGLPCFFYWKKEK